MKSTTIIALKILTHLAGQEKPVPMKLVAAEVKIGRDYLEKICGILRANDLIYTAQGRRGGIGLEPSPSNITAQQVAVLFERPSPYASEAIDYIDEQIRELLADITIHRLTQISLVESLS